MTYQIVTGEHLERCDPDGKLLDLSDQEMAENAFTSHSGDISVPQIQWIKEFSTQVTDGRIGRPAIRFGPISWLGAKRANRVKALIKGEVK